MVERVIRELGGVHILVKNADIAGFPGISSLWRKLASGCPWGDTLWFQYINNLSFKGDRQKDAI